MNCCKPYITGWRKKLFVQRLLYNGAEYPITLLDRSNIQEMYLLQEVDEKWKQAHPYNGKTSTRRKPPHTCLSSRAPSRSSHRCTTSPTHRSTIFCSSGLPWLFNSSPSTLRASIGSRWDCTSSRKAWKVGRRGKWIMRRDWEGIMLDVCKIGLCLEDESTVGLQ